MTTTVTIPWRKHAKQRPRGKAGQRSYTPKVTKDAEKIVRQNFLDAVGDGFEKYEGPIRVDVEMRKDSVTITINECAPYTERALTGDVDNYLKTIGDALNDVAWIDDKQIVDLRGVKV